MTALWLFPRLPFLIFFYFPLFLIYFLFLFFVLGCLAVCLDKETCGFLTRGAIFFGWENRLRSWCSKRKTLGIAWELLSLFTIIWGLKSCLFLHCVMALGEIVFYISLPVCIVVSIIFRDHWETWDSQCSTKSPLFSRGIFYPLIFHCSKASHTSCSLYNWVWSIHKR